MSADGHLFWRAFTAHSLVTLREVNLNFAVGQRIKRRCRHFLAAVKPTLVYAALPGLHRASGEWWLVNVTPGTTPIESRPVHLRPRWLTLFPGTSYFRHLSVRNATLNYGYRRGARYQRRFSLDQGGGMGWGWRTC